MGGAELRWIFSNGALLNGGFRVGRAFILCDGEIIIAFLSISSVYKSLNENDSVELALAMARIPSFLSNLCLRQNPKSLQPTTPQIRSRNLSVDQFNGNPDEISAQNRIFNLVEPNRSSEELGENYAQHQITSVNEIAKEVSNLIRIRPRWEQTLLTDFPTVNFTDPTVYSEVLKQSNVFLSLRFFFWLRSLSDSSFDPVLCNVMFSRLVEAKAAQAAMNFLDSTKFDPEPWYLELYIRCLCENGLIDKALDVFERLKKSIGYSISLETWNCALSHSVRTKRVDVVWKLYENMMEYNVITDVKTVGHLIQAFCLEENVAKGYGLLQQVLEAGHVPENIIFVKLISSFCKNRDYGKVSAVLNNMIAKNCSPGNDTYQEVINRLCKGGMTSEGFRIFNELKNRGYFPDRVMYTTMIHGLCEDKNLGGARKLWFEMIQNGIVPNEYTYSAFIDGLFKSGCINEAEKLHKEMLDKGYEESTISFNTRINGLCSNGKVEEARVLFEEMNEKGIFQDSITYSSLIKGFSQQGKITEATYFFNELLKKGFEPSSGSFVTLVEKLCEIGNVKEAEKLWVEMRSRGLEPAICSLNTIILGLSQQGRFAEMVECLRYMIRKGVRPKEKTFEEIIKCVYLDEMFDDALFVLEHMLKMGFVLRESICFSLVEKLCRDNPHLVRKSLDEILERR
ncbi:PREDICTED: pentatricopeptide repeat-containing protein At5g18950 [Erythranthe guttata]|nr:PREDICTED: pentatricopeptide repeat-containing protein At5g18950 [Erythranthe guttata]|eukprot:XP_012827854.1 PREDICTED: pentatricopeptide repeat-containing protein At5g18950 [Erythranthe guttata]